MHPGLLALAVACSVVGNLGLASGVVMTDAAVTSAGNAPAGPPASGPDHGVDDPLFSQLWSDDTDDPDATLSFGNVTTEDEFLAILATSTDIPFDEPPAAVAQWNAGDHREFPTRGTNWSVAPTGTPRRNKGPIRDATVRIFAIDPSTLVHDSTGTALTTAPDGTVRAVVDYRLQLRADDTEGPRRVRYWVDSDDIDEVTLSVDGSPHRTVSGSHRPVLAYSGLAGSSRLSVSATVSATVATLERHCGKYDHVNETCLTYWNATLTTDETTLTVTDSIDVTVETLATPTVVRATFDDGSQALYVKPNAPWSALSAGSAHVRSTWWVYTAGDDDWRTLEARTQNTSLTDYDDSPARPLQAHAVRMYDASVTGGNFTRIWTRSVGSPALPPEIDLSVEPTSTEVDAVGVRLPAGEPPVTTVTVTGLVRGSEQDATVGRYVRVKAVSLDADIDHQSNGTALVTVRLRDSDGAPVDSGSVRIAGTDVPVHAGQASAPIDPLARTVEIAYHPEPWWSTHGTRTYLPARTVALVPPTYPEPAEVIDWLVITALWFTPLTVLIIGLHYVSRGELLGGLR